MTDIHTPGPYLEPEPGEVETPKRKLDGRILALLTLVTVFAFGTIGLSVALVQTSNTVAHQKVTISTQQDTISNLTRELAQSRKDTAACVTRDAAWQVVAGQYATFLGHMQSAIGDLFNSAAFAVDEANLQRDNDSLAASTAVVGGLVCSGGAGA